jgi:hypothetical protein
MQLDRGEEKLIEIVRNISRSGWGSFSGEIRDRKIVMVREQRDYKLA